MFEQIIINCNEGYIYGYVTNKVVNLNYIFVKPEYRGNKFSISLMMSFLVESYRKGAVRIELDDCSNNYKTSKNLYLNSGLKYLHVDGPEMSGNIRSCIKKLTIKYPKINNLFIKTNQQNV
jgi:hypothetical protein